MKKIIIILVAVLLTNCSGNGDESEVEVVTKEQLLGNWRLTNINANGDNEEDDECERLDILKFTLQDVYVANHGFFAGNCAITNETKTTYTLDNNNLSYIGNPSNPEEFTVDGKVEIIGNNLTVTEKFGAGAGLEIFITSYTKIDDIIGRWQLTNINANGDNEEDDVCERMDTIEFFETGYIHVINHGALNGECIVTNNTSTTYTYENNIISYIGNPLYPEEFAVNGTVEIIDNETLTVTEEIYNSDNELEIYITSYERVN
ncbi:lipocalin family protein [Winogradskyella pulchriflava]|uniref:Lipocalin family protein n=1 Tax=Winogradskyella pulchriflava TaxID=1110688 RepID=A0ABV6Q8R3_9FLAO